MIFGKVENPGKVDFELPQDHPDTQRILSRNQGDDHFEAYVGCAKWNRKDLKNFYPRGTKDELSYYGTQFNCIELNATFYNAPSAAQVATWREKTPEGFKFFPKIPNTISHYKRLIEVQPYVEGYCEAIAAFGEKLGMTFLQLHDNFKPKDADRLERFVMDFPAEIPLAVEVRNQEWFSDPSEHFYLLLEKYYKTNVIVDTAGRRDMLHMRLTSPVAFIRYVGANHPTDYSRLDDWVERIRTWKEQGLQQLYFFVHQNIELESPLLSAYFIEKLNQAIGTNLKVPETL